MKFLYNYPSRFRWSFSYRLLWIVLSILIQLYTIPSTSTITSKCFKRPTLLISHFLFSNQVPHVISHVTKLDIDDKTLLASRDIGLQESCSLVSSLTLRCSRYTVWDFIYYLSHALFIFGWLVSFLQRSCLFNALTTTWPFYLLF